MGAGSLYLAERVALNCADPIIRQDRLVTTGDFDHGAPDNELV